MFLDSTNDCQKLVRLFNEDEAVWRSYEQKRMIRRLLSHQSPLPGEILDALDFLEAHEERPVRAIGINQ